MCTKREGGREGWRIRGREGRKKINRVGGRKGGRREGTIAREESEGEREVW